jgi:hypothetical protein
MSLAASTVPGVSQLLAEIRDMPAAALTFARGVSKVRTPEHLVPVRDVVRADYAGELGLLFGALQERFPDVGSFFGVFQAAVEMALMEHLARDELPVAERRLLRQL